MGVALRLPAAMANGWATRRPFGETISLTPRQRNSLACRGRHCQKHAIARPYRDRTIFSASRQYQ
jgi:hypothetical protein